MNELSENDENALMTGNTYALTAGLATIVQFYTEEGHDKVQARIHSVDPADGRTVLEGESRLCSMPVDVFRKHIDENRLAMEQRAIEAAKIAKQKRLNP